MNSTRVVLQDRKSHLYFKGKNDWTPDVEQAVNFGQVRTALEFARQTGQPNIDIVMTFGERRYDVRIAASY